MSSHARFERVLFTRYAGKRYLGVADISAIAYLQSSRERAQKFFAGDAGARTEQRIELFKQVLDLSWAARDVLDFCLSLVLSNRSLGVISEQRECWERIDLLRGKCKERKFRNGLHEIADLGFVSLRMLPTGTRHYNDRRRRWGTNQVVQVTWTRKIFDLVAHAPEIAPAVDHDDTRTDTHIDTLRQKLPTMDRTEKPNQHWIGSYAGLVSETTEQTNKNEPLHAHDHKVESTRNDSPAPSSTRLTRNAPDHPSTTAGESKALTSRIDTRSNDGRAFGKRRPIEPADPRTYEHSHKLFLHDLWIALRHDPESEALYNAASAQTDPNYPSGYPTALDWTDLVWSWPEYNRRQRIDIIAGQVTPALHASTEQHTRPATRPADIAPAPIIEIDAAELAQLRRSYWLSLSAVRLAARGLAQPPKGQTKKMVARCVEVFGRFKL